MALDIEWLGYAEGVVADQRGAMTVVGFYLPVWYVPSLPSPVNLTMLAVLSDGPEVYLGKSSMVLTLFPTVEDPDGQVVVAGQTRQTVPLPAPAFDDIRGFRMNTAIGIQMMVLGDGVYTLRLRVDADGRESAVKTTSLRVAASPSGATSPS